MSRIAVSFERDYRLQELRMADVKEQEIIVRRMKAINILDRFIEKRTKKVS